MAAHNKAHLNLLASELRHLSDDAIPIIYNELRTMMKNLAYTNMRDLVDEVWAFCPDAFPRSLTKAGMATALKRHTMVLLHDIIPAAHQFTWDWDNYFNWDHWAKTIAAAHDDRDKQQPTPMPQPAPGPLPGPPGPQVNPTTIWVWATDPPSGMTGNEVPQVVLDDAEKEGLVGMVRVNGLLFTIKPKEDSPTPGPGPANDSTKIYGKASVELAASKLGLRDDDMFSTGYVRCAEKVLKDVFKRHSSVEEFVRANFNTYGTSVQAGQKAKFKELIMSARTCDSIIRSYDGKTQKELFDDTVLEMHAASLARQDYTMRTANYDGADAISGMADFLLPTKAVTDAAAYTNTITKLKNNLRNTGGHPKENTTPNRITTAFVPMDQRKCYECGASGHLGKDCPERAKRKGGGKGAAKTN